MAYYRLYFLSGFSGHIERFEEFDAVDDEAAVAQANTKQGALPLELWCSHRKVVRIDSIDLASRLLAQRSQQKAVKAKVTSKPDVKTSKTENRSG